MKGNGKESRLGGVMMGEEREMEGWGFVLEIDRVG